MSFNESKDNTAYIMIMICSACAEKLLKYLYFHLQSFAGYFLPTVEIITHLQDFYTTKIKIQSLSIQLH